LSDYVVAIIAIGVNNKKQLFSFFFFLTLVAMIAIHNESTTEEASMALENFMTPEFAKEFFAKEKEMDVYVTLKVTMVQTQDIEGVMENTHIRLAHPDIRGYEVVSSSKVNWAK